MKKSLLLLILIYSYSLNAQDRIFTTTSKKAIQHFQHAQKEYNSMNFSDALLFLDKALEKDSTFIDAYLLKSQIHSQRKDLTNEIYNYNRAYHFDPDCYHNGYYHYGKALLKNGEYEKAKESFNKLKQYEDIKKEYIESLSSLIEKCNFGISAINNPVEFKPENIGSQINSELDEYWPSLNADETVMVFTRLIPRNSNFKNKVVSFKTHQEDLYYSYKVNDTWLPAKEMGININTGGNEGTQSVSIDGKSFFFTACNRSDSHGGCDIYYTSLENEKWTKPINLGNNINTKYKESQPSISSDGQTIYFASNRPGGKGKLDIWRSSLSEEGYWQKPENLGDSINTSQDEQSPFIHADCESLYFSSDGHLGLGGMDIFISTKIEDNSFASPENIGYPINTYKDELGLYITPQGNRAYYASDLNAKTGKDIYSFTLPEKVQPKIVIYVKGKITNAISKKPLQAKIELIDLMNSKTIYTLTSDKSNGNYLICLTSGKNYALNVSKRGYMFYSENFSLQNSENSHKPVILNIDLQPINIGSTAILNNVFFEIDSYELKIESNNEIDKLLSFLSDNPDLKIEISGHTDNTGSDAYNFNLSTKRAESVYNYLIRKNINSNRLSYKGYSDTKPIADNSSPEGRAKNRRTEFMIRKFK